jgi:predicted MFS family arabinose efflux permease
MLGDRYPPSAVLVGGAALSLAGLVVLALNGGPAGVLVSAAAYGTGYGAIQTSAFLTMIGRGARSETGAISALWNSGIDLGSSLGGTLIGLAAAHCGYGPAAWVLPIVVVLSLPLFMVPAKPISPPVAEAEIFIR